MQAILRRTFATVSNEAAGAATRLSNEAAAARTASTPLAVRLRRRHRKNKLPYAKIPGSDALESGMTESDFLYYVDEKQRGIIAERTSEPEWLARRNDRRQRLRGFKRSSTIIKQKNADGALEPVKVTETQVVGEKVYLPNIVIRLVRNHTPRGQPYNPYEATFRIPQSVTKTDLRNYLHAVYGVRMTYIRTDNYIAPLTHSMHNRRIQRGPSYKTYKRAVVGLVDPFYYPDAVEDMSSEERKSHEDQIEEMFQLKKRRESVKNTLLFMTKRNSKDWKWMGEPTTRRGTILRRIAEQRAAREQAILHAKESMIASREAA
jgi:large subunit ribosomal protein L23